MTDNPDLETQPGAGQPLGSVDLSWIPLGAGAHVVRSSGRLFEAISAFIQRRHPCDLYHSALEVVVPEGRFVIEQAPVPDAYGEQRGVVAEGPVATKWAGRLRIFRYEIRRWKNGRIPDAADAIASPVRVTDDLITARRVLDVLPLIPTPTWGRDELDTGEMWNSNSVVAWTLARSGIDVATIHPPTGGRAPGWNAGPAVAARGEARVERHRRIGLSVFAAFVAVSACAGAVGLATGALALGPTIDRRLPLHSPVFGALALAGVVGLPALVVAMHAWRGRLDTGGTALVAGVLLVVWIAIEIAFIRELSFLQAFFAAVGVIFVAIGRRSRVSGMSTTGRTARGSWSSAGGA